MYNWYTKDCTHLMCIIWDCVYVLSCVQLSATPWIVALQVPLSMEFSRQERWSWLPFPSPVDLPIPGIEPKSPTWQADSLPLSHQGSPVAILSEWVSEVAQLYPTLCDPMDCSLQGSSVHEIFQARVLEWVAISFSRDLPNRGTESKSPALQADALPSEPPGKPKDLSKRSNKKKTWIN